MKKIFIILLLLNNLFANENENSLFNEDNVKEIQLRIKINNNKLKITEYMDITNIYRTKFITNTPTKIFDFVGDKLIIFILK